MFRSYKSPKTFLLAKCKLYYNWSYLKIVRGTATRSIGRRYKALQKVEPNLFFIFTVVFVVGAGVSFVVGWFVLFLVFRCFHQISFFFHLANILLAFVDLPATAAACEGGCCWGEVRADGNQRSFYQSSYEWQRWLRIDLDFKQLFNDYLMLSVGDENNDKVNMNLWI